MHWKSSWILPAAFLCGGLFGLGIAWALAGPFEPRGRAGESPSEVALGAARECGSTATGGSREELAAAREEARRYRAGLTAAVAELNRLAPLCGGAAEPSPPPRESQRERSRSLRLQGPKLQVWGEDLIAFGTVSSSGSEEEIAEVVLELAHDGEIVDQAVLEVAVPAGGEADFEHTFWAGQLEGTYRVQGHLAR